MSAETAAAVRPMPWAPRLVPLFCFAVLGGLTARSSNSAMAVAAAVASFLVGWLALILLGWLLAGSSNEVGRKEARWAVTRGFLLLIPFTILAIAATEGLGWDSAAAFASAGIMTGSATAGVELAGAGGRRLTFVLLPMIFGAALAALWIICTSVAVPTLWAAVQPILSAQLRGGTL